MNMKQDEYDQFTKNKAIHEKMKKREEQKKLIEAE